MIEVRVSLEPWEDSLSYRLASLGIPTIVEETVTGDYDGDPWAPRGNAEGVSIILDVEGANRLTKVLEKALEGRRR